jgi:hypothetical protein
MLASVKCRRIFGFRAYILEVAGFRYLTQFDHERKSKLHRRAVKLALFPKPQQTFEVRKSKHSSLEITVMPTVTLRRLRKLELTQQRVARIEIFDAIASSASQVVWIVFSAESSDFSWETKSLKLSGIEIRNLESSNLFSIRLREIFFDLQLVAGISSIFRKPSLDS